MGNVMLFRVSFVILINGFCLFLKGDFVKNSCLFISNYCVCLRGYRILRVRVFF